MRYLLCCASISLFVATAVAQIPLGQHEVRSISFSGNANVKSSVLEENIQTKETPSWFWKFLGNISSNLGGDAVYFDPFVLGADVVRLREFYRDQGFFGAAVDTVTRFDREARRVDITFAIVEGRRSLIDTLEFRGLETLPTVLLEDINSNHLVHQGDPYVRENVENEFRRIVTLFYNNGYVRVERDTSTGAVRYASTNNIKLVYGFLPHERFSFGAITVESDSTVKERVDTDIVLRHLDFAEGDYYSEEKKIDSERNLNRLGVFDASRIEPQVSKEAIDAQVIPTKVTVRPRPFHELTPEIGASDENSAFNLVTGIGYSNRNFFGGARNFSTRFRVSLQSIQDIEFNRMIRQTGIKDSSLISKIELTTQVVQPYLLSNKVSLSVGLSAILEKQKTYYAPIYQARVGVSAQLARYTRGLVEFNLERVDPIPIGGGDLLEVPNRPDLKRQFNSIITVSIQRDKRNDLFSPSDGFLHSASIEEAGLIPSLFGGLFGTRLDFSKYIKLSGVGQWYGDLGTERLLVWAARIRGGFSSFVGDPVEKIDSAGVKTLTRIPVPITRRFYAGGSESVRGWKSRELGAVPYPGGGGNALFEANVEARWRLFRNAGKLWFLNLENISLVGFYDVGNMWNERKDIRLSDLAMAAGLGFRWDTIAGPIRIDFGMRIYDPKDTSDRKWVTQRRFFHDTYGLVHFGIGHAF